MKKNRWLTVYAVLVFLFLMIPLVIITVTAFGGGSAITFPIDSFSLKWFGNVFALKSFRRSFLTSLKWHSLQPLLLLVGIPKDTHWHGQNPRKTASAIRIFVSNHCSWDCSRFYPVSVPDPDFPPSGYGKSSGRPFSCNSALCNPCSWFCYGAV